jgi:hypothetical protein
MQVLVACSRMRPPNIGSTLTAFDVGMLAQFAWFRAVMILLPCRNRG